MAWPREIYVATATGGVYYTANFVNPAVQPIWTAINNGLGTDLYCHEFHLDPFHEADRQFVLSNASNTPANNSLYRRYLGATWTAILTPASLATLSGHSPCEIWGFCCDPSIDGRMWALVFITGVGDMAIYSDDWGDTWNLTTAYYNSYYNLHSVRAYGDLVYVRDCVGVGAYPYVEFSANKGSTWGYIATDLVDWFPGAALNPLEPTKLYHSDNTPRLQYYTMGGGLTTLINGFTLDDWDTIWFDPVDVLHQRVIYNNKLYVTTDGWATMTDSGAITLEPTGISPWYGSDQDKMLLEITLSHALGRDHVVATLDGEGDTNPTPISGSNSGTPPYTDSIPYTCGQICRCGLQAVHQGKGKIYTNAVAMYGYSDTGLDRGIPMAGDRGAWDAKSYPLRHTDDIDDNGIHWTETEIKSWDLADFGSDSADVGDVPTADGAGGIDWLPQSGGGGGGGGGNVSDTGATTANHLAVWNGTSDHTIKDGGAVPAGAGVDGWIACTGTWTYSSADAPIYVISVNNDQTGIIGVGMRIKLTHAAATKYFIITAVGAYSGGVTLITVYGGTDYTLAATAITSPYYSMVKAPFGFPLNPTKWTVRISDTSDCTQATPTPSTWYNLGSLQISIPIGIWRVSYQVILDFSENASLVNQWVTLSTANNSESDKELSGLFQLHAQPNSAPTLRFLATIHKEKMLELTSKTAYYLNSLTELAQDSIDFRGDKGNTIIEAVCVYL